MNYDKENVYFFGMAILIRISQQTASETLQIGAQRLAGLILGVSLAKVVVDNTHNLAEKTALTCCFDFILLALSHYEPYFQAVQYAIVTSITTQKYFATPEMLVQRLADNVFAFIFYVFICIFFSL
ncbi:hypothetical protein AGDE_13418 [Angomonas deanei]|nr:hypothetical protein AGDE_13418 [Angomonas deanei]|eukprot:EPY22362.1 hypothetical protein AGDE_13418 [Angomonas deanei]